jgi:hypothetical protein
MRVYQSRTVSDNRLFVKTGEYRCPRFNEYFISDCSCNRDKAVKANFNFFAEFPIARQIRSYELLWYKLAQWADRHINWPAVGFWIVILFCAAFWYGVFKLIWWAWYCL